MPHPHADALARLDAWTGPSEYQTALAQAYVAFLTARPDACDRACAPGHLTAAAMVFSAELTHVALVLHGIVGAWIQAGGHLESTDATLVDAAAREVHEELGLLVELDPVPVTLHCHPITCRGYEQVTRHLDVRFLGRVTAAAELAVSSESRDVAWWPVDALPPGIFPEVRDLVELGRARLLGHGAPRPR